MFFTKNEITDITNNSKDVIPGCLFAAINGASFNGENYIHEAISKGATCILRYGDNFSIDKLNGVCEIKNPNPRKFLAEICADFFKSKLDNISAVTGTNGKTSTVDFLRQFWELSEISSASIGTLGLINKREIKKIQGALTSPDSINFHRTLKWLCDSGIKNIAIEASSHGLDQYRIFGIPFSVVGFTNFSEDHLDYHKTMDQYWEAKTKLFYEYSDKNTQCILNINSDKYASLKEICACKRVITYGINEGDFNFSNIMNGSATFCAFQKKYNIELNIDSRFQLYNILCASAMAFASGVNLERIIDSIPKLCNVAGRMQLAGKYNGRNIYIDYAHTPDGLYTVLQDMKFRTSGKLIVVFGCGGNRDKEKRPIMGKIAEENADTVIITDDNPRKENPSDIRNEILFGCKNAIEIGDRKDAILHAIKMMNFGDNLLIAGKGHENYQEIDDKIIPFSDIEIVKNFLRDNK